MAPTLKTLVSFNGAGDGAYPTAGVVIDANGNLLGTTEQEGPAETDYVDGVDIVGGTMFEIPYANGAYAGAPTVLGAFAGPNGSTPLGGLIVGPDGNLFGTTSSGGSTYTVLESGAAILGKGVVYEVPYGGGDYGAPSVLYSDTVGFTSVDYGLGLDSQGDLFGTLSTEETSSSPTTTALTSPRRPSFCRIPIPRDPQATERPPARCNSGRMEICSRCIARPAPTA